MIILLVTLGPFEQIDASRTGSTSQCTTDNNGNSAVNITDKGNMNFKGDFETEKLSVGDNVITQDSNGVLCINGKRILVEGE